MKILHGLFDHMVLQRDSKNQSDARIGGTCAGGGRIVATVKSRGRVVRGFSAIDCGTARAGRFQARLRGLPTGGPYDIELKLLDAGNQSSQSVTVRDVLVGDVWILGGQSNMQGCGLRKHRARPHPRVRAFYMDDRWAVALDPIHNLDAAVDEVHRQICGGALPGPERVAGVGPGVAFAQEMLRRTGVPQGLLACAHGGTSMAQWNPEMKKLGGGSLYGATVRRVDKNGGKVAGVVWYQGESDAVSNNDASYTANMRALIRALRRDCGDASLPVVMVQISRVVGRPDKNVASWNSVQDQQRRLALTIPKLATVPAIDLRLDDAIHIAGDEQQRLGRRLAQAMDVLRRGTRAGKPPIELGAITIARQPGRDLSTITVQFKNVSGRLSAAGQVKGFSLSQSQPISGVYDVRLEKDRAIVYATPAPAALNTDSLHYGAGCDPVCNVTDDDDRTLPVFGPIRLGKARAATPFCRSFEVAYLDQPFEALNGRLPDELKFKRWTSPDDFADSRAIYPQWPSQNGCLIYRAALECPEPMALDLLLGYDGPMSLWMNGRPVACDPRGTNPCLTDELAVKVSARAGRNELLLALGNQNGRAWGVILRAARRDVSSRQVETGKPAYSMPQWK